MERPNVNNDYEWASIGNGYYHKETGESFEKDLDEYIEAEKQELIEENELLKMCQKLGNPMDAEIQTDFKIFVSIANKKLWIYTIFDHKLLLRDFGNRETLIEHIKNLKLKNGN